MTAPEERVYCGDRWCDGDHLFSGERCDELTCLTCDNVFVASRGYGNFCSEECASAGLDENGNALGNRFNRL